MFGGASEAGTSNLGGHGGRNSRLVGEETKAIGGGRDSGLFWNRKLRPIRVLARICRPDGAPPEPNSVSGTPGTIKNGEFLPPAALPINRGS